MTLGPLPFALKGITVFITRKNDYLANVESKELSENKYKLYFVHTVVVNISSSITWFSSRDVKKK